MATVLSRILSPAPLLYLFVVITQFGYGAYLGAQFEFQGAQFEFPAAATLLFTVGLLWAVGWWLRTDRRRRGVLSVYDLGFFLFLAWPIVMPYYLIKTRGAKGLLVMLGFVAAYVGAEIIGIILSVLAITMRS
jgi:polyferredoxin